jgi:hypothetical protein
MKKFKVLLSAFILIGFLHSCTAPVSENKEKEETKEETKTETKTEEKKESPKTAVCKTEEKKEGPDPIITKNCQYGNIQTKSVGYPDMKGRYSYSYELMLDGKKVKNSVIFNDKMPELFSKLNDKILEEYSKFYNAEDSKDCFSGMPKNPKFKMDDLSIDLDDKNMIFNVSFGLPGMCLAVDASIISIPLEEIEAYLKK